MSAQSDRWQLPAVAVRCLLGGVLLLAAILKLKQWLDLPLVAAWPAYTTATPGSFPAVLHLAEIGGELLLGCWLVSGVRTRDALTAGAVAYACFAATSLWKIRHGVGRCGCFGSWEIPPAFSYWMDAAFLLLALGALFPGHLDLRRSGRTAVLLLSGILSAALVLHGMALFLEHYSMKDPSRWVGMDWPPKGVVSIDADLSKGRWVVLIYSSGCGHCKSLASSYGEDARGWKTRGRKIRMAMIDADPGAPFGDGTNKSSPATNLREGVLLDSRIYRSQPILLVLENGRVVVVHEGWEKIDWEVPPCSRWINPDFALGGGELGKRRGDPFRSHLRPVVPLHRIKSTDFC